MLTNNKSSNRPLLILKPVSKKDKKEVTPYFEISENIDGKFVARDDTSINIVSGRLIKIESKEDTYEGDKFYRVRIFLKDNDEAYMINARLNIATRSLVNCLFNLNDFNDVSIKYYRSPAGYESFYVSQDGERVGWKFESDQIPKAIEVPFRNTVMRDFSQVDEFFVEQIKALNVRLNPSHEGAEANEESSQNEQPEQPEQPEDPAPLPRSKGGRKKTVEVEETDEVPF